MPAAQINQPSNQIKLTNVSLVRMKKGKKRFEIACYKNTITSYRAGNEPDLDNVLQIPNVFLNVSKGQVANNEDIKKSFPGMTRHEVVVEILNKGEVQVGEKERSLELERVHKEVVDLVAGRLVDPKSKRVYTTGMIEKALDQLSSQGGHAPAVAEVKVVVLVEGEAKHKWTGEGKAKHKWTGVVTTKSAKSQALDAMKALIAHQPIPVARARMRLRITCPTDVLKQNVKTPAKAEGEEPTTGSVKDRILAFVEQVETEENSGKEWECIGFVEPGAYKLLSDFISTQTKGKARAEVLDTTVTHED